MNNFEVAVMMTINELGRRYGLEPYEIDASIHTPTSGPEVIVRFETPPEAKADAYRRMMRDLGIADPGGSPLLGSEASVWKTLQTALRRAPKPRGRV
jgi:hypothetical protein